MLVQTIGNKEVSILSLHARAILPTAILTLPVFLGLTDTAQSTSGRCGNVYYGFTYGDQGCQRVEATSKGTRSEHVKTLRFAQSDSMLSKKD